QAALPYSLQVGSHSLIAPILHKLFRSRGTPVSQTHEGFQPGESKRTKFVQQAKCTLAPGRALCTKPDLHQRKFQRHGNALLAVNRLARHRGTFMDASGEAAAIGTSRLTRHGTQTHAPLPMVSKDQVRHELGVRLAVMLSQPTEHGSEFMTEEASAV